MREETGGKRDSEAGGWKGKRKREIGERKKEEKERRKKKGFEDSRDEESSGWVVE